MKRFTFIIIAMFVLFIPILAQDGGGIDAGGILTIVFGLLMTVFGGVAAWLKRKSNKLANFSQQSIEAAMAGNDLVQWQTTS